MSPINDNNFECWLEQVSDACGRYAARRLDDHASGSLSMSRNQTFAVARIDIARTRLSRRLDQARGDDGKFYFLVIQHSGNAFMEQAGQAHCLRAGDMMLLDAAQPCELTYEAESSQLSLILPRDDFDRLNKSATVQAGTRLEGGLASARMVQGLIHQVGLLPEMSVDESDAALHAVMNVVSPFVRAPLENPVSEQKRIYRLAIQFIEDNLRAPDLHPPVVAREVGVSLRGLYRSFAEHGLVVAQYIRERRMERCVEELVGSHRRTQIACLADMWGFNEPSHFSSAFKARYGMTPSEFRRLHDT
jgi:AraC family transcriptional activator of tynA and feaB